MIVEQENVIESSFFCKQFSLQQQFTFTLKKSFGNCYAITGSTEKLF